MTTQSAQIIEITDAETCRLTLELATMTGKSAQSAVLMAVREALSQERKLAEEIREVTVIADRLADLLGDEPAPDHGQLLYDEQGLPKCSSTLPHS